MYLNYDRTIISGQTNKRYIRAKVLSLFNRQTTLHLQYIENIGVDKSQI